MLGRDVQVTPASSPAGRAGVGKVWGENQKLSGLEREPDQAIKSYCPRLGAGIAVGRSLIFPSIAPLKSLCSHHCVPNHLSAPSLPRAGPGARGQSEQGAGLIGEPGEDQEPRAKEQGSRAGLAELSGVSSCGAEGPGWMAGTGLLWVRPLAREQSAPRLGGACRRGQERERRTSWSPQGSSPSLDPPKHARSPGPQGCPILPPTPTPTPGPLPHPLTSLPQFPQQKVTTLSS